MAADTVFPGTVRFDKPKEASKSDSPRKRFVRTITTADFVDADTSEEVALGTDDDGVAFPANARVLWAVADLKQVVAGGTISAVTITVGDAADPDELLTSTNIFTGAALGKKYTPAAAYVPLTLEATAYAPIAVITFTGGNSNTATTGRIVIVIDYELPEIPVAA